MTIRTMKHNHVLHKTDDLGKFRMNDMNRPLKPRPDLETSMIEHGFMPSKPLQVVEDIGGTLCIICGHHRFSTAKELKIPVYYVLDDSNTDLLSLEMNSKQAWSLEDFINAYANEGRQAYIELLKFRDENEIPMHLAIPVLGNYSGGHGGVAKTGGFVVADRDSVEKVMSVINVCRNLDLPYWSKASFANAIINALKVEGVDYMILKDRLRNYSHKLVSRGTMMEFLTEIEKVYNYNAVTKRVPIVYLWGERRRSPK